MERRSGRGRPSASSPDQGKSPAVGGRRSSTGARGGESSEREQEIVTSPDVPEVGNEEIVLNRRGTVSISVGNCNWKGWLIIAFSYFLACSSKEEESVLL